MSTGTWATVVPMVRAPSVTAAAGAAHRARDKLLTRMPVPPPARPDEPTLGPERPETVTAQRDRRGGQDEGTVTIGPCAWFSTAWVTAPGP
jgi:hypothetical protein